MLKTINIIFFMIFMLAAAALYFMRKDNTPDFDNYSCNANFTIRNRGLVIPMVVTFNFDGNVGMLHYNSPLFKDNNVNGMVNRKVSFLLEQHNSTVKMTSVHVNRLGKDSAPDTDVTLILPDFFIKQDATITFETVKSKRGVLFVYDSFPMFFCQR